MTMRKRLVLLCAIAGMMSWSGVALADPITYIAILNGPGENPPNASPATGTALFTLNGNLLTINISFSGLIGGPASAAHIHCCAGPGANANVWVPFDGFPNATSGTYTNTVDLSTFAFSGGGTEAALIAGMNNATAYTNIHNATFPGGEIRGQIIVTPEPESLWLVLSGGTAAWAFMRRRALA
jgi:CHRD domain